MLNRSRRIVSALFASFLACMASLPAAADPEIDQLVRSPAGKDWVTNGGGLTNQRYSTLKQINTENVKQLKGAWMTRLKGSGYGGKYSVVVFEVDGQEYITIVTGGNVIQGSATGDAVWTFAMNGNVQPLHPPPPLATAAGPLGPIAEGVDKVRIADNNVEYSYSPARLRVRRGAQVNFVNLGDIPHSATATAVMAGKWDTGILGKGESKAITFNETGTYYYICTPHPWMYGQVIVEP